MTADISRHFADASKQYRSLAHQQGRLPTDAEANHAEAIDAWQAEAEFRETIAELGTPDQGFRIIPVEGDASTFTVRTGSMYADGVRIYNPTDFRFNEQGASNWLTIREEDEISEGDRVFAWLEAETCTVTAVEDAELLDPALRGADGAARTMVRWRVRQITSDADECLDALEDGIGADRFALYDPEFGVINSSGTLAVGFESGLADLDLCKPTAADGYFGDRNATFCVKITGDGRLIWGEDNAAALYRVQLGSPTGKITFLTHPRDEWQRPKVGQTVELLRGSTLLENREKVAERNGVLMRVTGSYANGSIDVLPTDIPADWDAWLAGLSSELFADDAERFFYLRVWTGGGDDGEVDRAYTPGASLALGETGLNVTITDDVLKGDSWTFSARPDSPHQVLPWAMRDGMTPHSPRRLVVPLGFIDLSTGETHDCRLRFRALQKIQSCCTITVGDGIVSRGDTDSIQEAIDLLPDYGGEICLLRGEHFANITLQAARNIRFSGCKGRASWEPQDESLPALTLIDCNNISIDGIRVIAGDVPAIVAGVSDVTDPSITSGNLTISDCTLDAPSGQALSVSDLSGVKLLRTFVKAGPFPDAPGSDVTTGYSAVYLQGERLLVERCTIDATIGNENVAQKAIGGIHIGGASEGVAIRQCAITEGTGTGIVLGSIEFIDDPNAGTSAAAASAPQTLQEAILTAVMNRGFKVTQDARGCIKVEVIPGGGGNDPSGIPAQVPVSEGEVSEVLIEGNTIFGMGANGIGTYPLGLFGPNDNPALDAIAVDTLEVSNNRIVDCRRNEINLGEDMALDRLFMPFGGVALSIVSNGLFRENHIEQCGINDGAATCGIGVSYGEMLRFEDNVIFGNGRHEAGMVPVGCNSAIEVRFATGGLPTFTRLRAGLRGSDKPALSIQNNMLDAPAGRAIRSLARGPVRVTDNRLIAGNPSRALSNFLGSVTGLVGLFRTLPEKLRVYAVLDSIFDLIGGDCVNITNIGLAEDLWTMLMVAGASGDETDNQSDGNSFEWLSFGLVNAAINARWQHPLQGGGEIMFANNQTSLRAPSGIADPKGQSNGVTAEGAMAAEARDSGNVDAQDIGIAPAPPPDARVEEPRKETEDDVVEMVRLTETTGFATRQPTDLTRSGLGSVSSIFLASLDDIYFGDNQCEVESERVISILHALLFSVTLRTMSNRMQEGGATFRSIVGYALRMHNAANNQTTAKSDFGALIPSGSKIALNNQSIF